MEPIYIPGEMDALPLEYKLQNRAAGRNIDITNFVNDPVLAGVCGVFGLGLMKQPLDYFHVEVRSFPDNRADATLIGVK